MTLNGAAVKRSAGLSSAE